MSNLEAIEKRRTFGIISHPDAGKTTLTEKLLLFGGAIQSAGAVKNNKIKLFFFSYGQAFLSIDFGSYFTTKIVKMYSK